MKYYISQTMYNADKIDILTPNELIDEEDIVSNKFYDTEFEARHALVREAQRTFRHFIDCYDQGIVKHKITYARAPTTSRVLVLPLDDGERYFHIKFNISTYIDDADYGVLGDLI